MLGVMALRSIACAGGRSRIRDSGGERGHGHHMLHHVREPFLLSSRNSPSRSAHRMSRVARSDVSHPTTEDTIDRTVASNPSQTLELELARASGFTFRHAGRSWEPDGR